MGKVRIHIVDVTDFNLPDGTKSVDWFMKAFGKLGLLDRIDLQVYDGTESIFPEPDEVKDGKGGIIITGSSGAVFEEKPWIPPLLEFIRDAHSREAHILGVCFGHHALATALGGTVEANPRGRELGTFPIYLTDEGRDDPILRGMDSPEFVNLSHKTHVTKLPEGAVRLAFNRMTPTQAFRVRRSVGVQFHPEITPIELKQLVFMFKNVLIRRENYLDDEEHLEDFVTTFQETPAAMRVLSNFIDSIDG